MTYGEGKGGVLELGALSSMVDLCHQQSDVWARSLASQWWRRGLDVVQAWSHAAGCIGESGRGIGQVVIGELASTSCLSAGDEVTTLCSSLQPCALMQDSHPLDKVSRYLLPSSKEAAVAIAATIS